MAFFQRGTGGDGQNQLGITHSQGAGGDRQSSVRRKVGVGVDVDHDGSTPKVEAEVDTAVARASEGQEGSAGDVEDLVLKGLWNQVGTGPGKGCVLRCLRMPLAAVGNHGRQLPGTPGEIDLGQDEIQLAGAYESTSLFFATPANWDLAAGTHLDLAVGVSFSTSVQTSSQSQSNVVVIGGGTLTVSMNNVVLAVIQLNQLGEIRPSISIPLDAFTTIQNGGLNQLTFLLDSRTSCRIAGSHTVVLIHPTSFLTLPHTLVKPPTSLVNFPRPIFQDSFIPDSALLIVPDHPSAAELQAALTVGAGLANLSSSALTMDLTTLSKFSEQANTTLASDNHLIFVGKAGSIPLLGWNRGNDGFALEQFACCAGGVWK